MAFRISVAEIHEAMRASGGEETFLSKIVTERFDGKVTLKDVTITRCYIVKPRAIFIKASEPIYLRDVDFSDVIFVSRADLLSNISNCTDLKLVTYADKPIKMEIEQIKHDGVDYYKQRFCGKQIKRAIS